MHFLIFNTIKSTSKQQQKRLIIIMGMLENFCINFENIYMTFRGFWEVKRWESFANIIENKNYNILK